MRHSSDEAEKPVLTGEESRDMAALGRILEAERASRKIRESAREERSGLEARFETEKSALKERLVSEQREEIALYEKEKRAGTDAKIAEREKELQGKKDQLYRAFEERRESLARTVFDTVTGNDAG